MNGNLTRTYHRPVPVAYVVWERYFRIFPLSYFGIENVQLIAKWESTEWRVQVFAHEGMTSNEWIRVNNRQLEVIRAELRQTDIESLSSMLSFALPITS
ncbi:MULTISPECIES: hypothetical protein [unclassified Leclercia]|uniref:hypothetical protein n=1 Tax=unclassified Leclercia TaxID=2627398 RepID=UPI001FEE8950|nr:hypothetical protein [Leclercia sp. W17]MCG1034679.1 hypothetical protein [Bacillus amyloliquefaciens]